MNITLICCLFLLQELPNLPDVQDADPTVVHNKKILETFRAKVVSVKDGDSIVVLNKNKEQVEIRMDSIDTPEFGQAFGRNAKKAVSESIFDKTVTVQKVGTDRYKRTLAFIQIDGKDLATAMVKNGFAWEYSRYSKSDSLGKLQAEAKKKRVGLWADAEPTPPWLFRKSKKKK